jgi:hypothetical protein
VAYLFLTIRLVWRITHAIGVYLRILKRRHAEKKIAFSKDACAQQNKNFVRASTIAYFIASMRY